MKEIQLSQGKVAQVDDSDYEWLNQWKWYASECSHGFYAKRTLNGQNTTIRMHRLITGAKKGELVDHKDGITLNNQRDNLRLCTTSQNRSNSKNTKNSSSKYKGVSYYKTNGKWVSEIEFNKKRKKLGYFDTELEAGIIYNIACRKYHKEFARPNKF